MAYEKAFFHKDLGEFITPRIVLAWPNVMVARRVKGDETSSPRFTVTGLIPKAADISVLMADWDRAATEMFGKGWQTKKSLNRPIYKTEDEDALAQFADDYPWAIKASAKEEFKPKLYDPPPGGGKAPKEWSGDYAADFYSGRRALLGGKFFAYKTGKGGVSFGLNRVILLEHGERLPLAGGGPRPITDGAGFEAVDIGAGESASELFQ